MPLRNTRCCNDVLCVALYKLASKQQSSDWRAWDSTSLFFGYRYYSMDYSKTLSTGPFAYDVEQHGPVLGVKFRF